VERVQKEEALVEFVSAFQHSWASDLALGVSSGEKELEGCVCTDGQQMVWASQKSAPAWLQDPCGQEEEGAS